MSGDQNWRTEVNAGDYFGHQQKKLNIADRRPVIRRASDLVGPGIAPNAVQITNFNDLLATYNGFFSADVGALNAPNDDDQFSGITTSDSVLGGTQTFTSLATGETFSRTFTRSPLDPSALYWSDWQGSLEGRVAALEALDLGDRTDDLEDAVDDLEAAANPLRSGTINFFGTNLSEGTLITGDVTFPISFASTPVAWAIVAGAPATGSAPGMAVLRVDSVTTDGCRLVLMNTSSLALATFTDLPVRWFAQKVN